MNHTEFCARLDRFAAGELPVPEQHEMEAHLERCEACRAEAAILQKWKELTRKAGKRYEARAKFRAELQKRYGSNFSQRRRSCMWAIAAAACGVLTLTTFLAARYQTAQRRRQVFAEIVDQHSAVLSRGSSLDVASSDDQAVESWFREELPFGLHVPEIRNTPFSLAGGRLAFLDQTPGAQLIFVAKGRRISAFVFPENKSLRRVLGGRDMAYRRAAFQLEICGKREFRYLIVGDTDPETIHQLADLLAAEE